MTSVVKGKSICTKRLRKNKNFPYIEQLLYEAIVEYPVLSSVLCKMDIIRINQAEVDAMVSPVWKDRIFSFECRYKLFWNENFISQESIEPNDIKGVFWHEIGHVLSVYCHTSQNYSRVNKNGYLNINFIGMYKFLKAGGEWESRLCILDLFWEEMRSKYSSQNFDKLEYCLSLHLTAQNNSELLAECYKYAYAGREHYGNDEIFLDIIRTAENIINDFKLQFLL